MYPLNTYYKIQENPQDDQHTTSLAVPLIAYIPSEILLDCLAPFFDATTKKALRQVNWHWNQVMCSSIHRVSGSLYEHVFVNISWRTQERCLRIQEKMMKTVIGKMCVSALTPCLFRQISVEWSKVNHFLNAFKQFTKLQHASISHITSFEMERLAPHFTTLHSLTLRASPVRDAGFHSLSTLTHLQVLTIQRLYKITDAGLNALRPLTSLHSLSIESCRKISFAGVAQLQHLPLQNLSFMGFSEITPEEVLRTVSAKSLAGFKTVENLHFSLCWMHHIEAVMHIEALQTLTLDACYSSTKTRYRFDSLENVLKQQGFQIIYKEHNKYVSGPQTVIEASTFQFTSNYRPHIVSLSNVQTYAYNASISTYYLEP